MRTPTGIWVEGDSVWRKHGRRGRALSTWGDSKEATKMKLKERKDKSRDSASRSRHGAVGTAVLWVGFVYIHVLPFHPSYIIIINITRRC